MKKTQYLLLLCVIPILSYAQLNTRIKGQIDSETLPLLFLKSGSDSSFVRSTIPNADNIFIFEQIPSGNYYLESSENGSNIQLLKTNIEITDEGENEIDLGTISYESKVHELDEIIITAQKPVYQSKVGKFIFNVENSAFTLGNNTLEMLQRTPLVVVDPNDNITVQGKSPGIYINGRKSELEAAQLVSYLKNIPAEQISRIEVIPVPPSKYDAAGSGGVIDIIMKRSTRLGLTGNANFTYQIYKRNGIFPALNLNLNTGKARFFLSGSYSQSDNKYKIESITTYFNDIENQIWASDAEYSNPFRKNRSYYISGGTEIFLNDKNTLYFETNYQHSRSGSENTDQTSVYKEKSLATDSLIRSMVNGSNRSDVFNVNLYHSLNLRNTGGRLETAVGYFNSQNENLTHYTSEILSETNDPLSHINYIIKMPPSAWGWNAKTDLYGKWGEKLAYGTGLKYAYTNSGFEQTMDIQDGEKHYDNFLYKEDIFAAYVDLQFQLNKQWVFKGGLRAENTYWRGQNKDLKTKNDKTYLDLFPTLFIKYSPVDNHTFELSYTRRINRPGFSQLNPAKRYNNPYSYVIGNPELTPQIYDIYQFNYIFKNQYALYLMYGKSDNGIYYIREMDNINKVAYHLPINLTTNQRISASLNIPVTIVKNWWNLNASLSQQFEKANRPDYGYKNNRWEPATTLNLRSLFNLSQNKKTQAEVSFFYISEHYYGIQKVSEVSSLHFAFSQKVLGDNGLLKLGAENIANWGVGAKNWMKSESQTGSYYQYGTDSYYGFKLSFSYKFESGLKRNTQNKSSLNDEQRNRTRY